MAPRSSPYASPRYGRRQSLIPSPCYSTSVLSPGHSSNSSPWEGGRGLPKLAVEDSSDDRDRERDRENAEQQNADVCPSYSARRSSLNSLNQAKYTSGSTSGHPHKWWKPFNYAPSTISNRNARRNSGTSSVKLIPPRITKTQYPENV